MKAKAKTAMRPNELNKQPVKDQPDHERSDTPDENKAVRSIKNALIASGGFLVLAVLIAVSSYIAFGTKPQTSNNPASKASIVSGFLPVSAAPAIVDITSSGFTPATISIKVGQAVAWTNNDTSPHFITPDDPKPAGNTPNPSSDQAINPSDSYSYVFDKAGTYTYHDNLSPDFRGAVIVK